MFGFKKWKRKRASQRAFPEVWRTVLEEGLAYYAALSEEDRQELRRHILVFLSEKRFEGCGGLEITDEIRVTIAAQACILLLHRQTDYYPGLSSILIYPGAYIAPETHVLPDGIVTEDAVHIGESWPRGSVVLSWEDVLDGIQDPHDGYNVVFHEFAHQLDQDGAEFGSDSVFQDRSRFSAWAKVFQEEFDRLRHDLRHDRPTFLDEYGAGDPAEFFAVATEYFFELPRELQENHPDLYRELKFFYRQDPAEW